VTADHRIYLLGWGTDPDTTLTGGANPVKLSDLLSASKAQIRAMFWDNRGTPTTPPNRAEQGNNEEAWKFVNRLPNGAAIWDHKLPFEVFGGQLTGIRGGVHHQKLLVVSGSAGLIGFTGGMDISNTRTGFVLKPGNDVPLHDVHVRIFGPGAQWMLDVFSERWLDHPDASGLEQAKFGATLEDIRLDFVHVRSTASTTHPPPSCTDRPNRKSGVGTAAVAIGRTYANLRKFTQNNESYVFAPIGKETAWNLVSNGVSKARKFIYIEDQYLVSRRLTTALAAKLSDPQFQFLLILMQASTNVDFPFVVPARNDVRAAFSKVDPDRRKWRMFSLQSSSDPQRQQWCGNYVHSKTQIYDDDCAIIGSCNVDDRGYSYDTEIVACITEDPLGRAAGSHFARDLRIALWHKHLGVPHAQLTNWTKGLQFWLKPPASAMVFDNSELENDPSLGMGPTPLLSAFKTQSDQWTQSIDPDADLITLTGP
jgi:phosphatidylserine/phosphatidylglycerophosphate/cardiolipin synthase-like enzyme